MMSITHDTRNYLLMECSSGSSNFETAGILLNVVPSIIQIISKGNIFVNKTFLRPKSSYIFNLGFENVAINYCFPF